MRSLLKDGGHADVSSTEFGSSTDDVVDQFITDALSAHNPSYSLSSLPTREEFLVLLKAWINVEYARAGKSAEQFPMNSPAGGGDKSQMLRNHLELVRQLEERYQSECERLGVGLGGDEASLAVGTMVRTNWITDELTPDVAQRAPDAVTLSDPSGATSSTLTLVWSESKITDFNWYKVYRHTSAGLKDLTTLTTSGAKYLGVIDAATEVETLYQRHLVNYKVTGLTSGTTYHFVVVVADRNNRIAVSNEVSLSTTS